MRMHNTDPPPPAQPQHERWVTGATGEDAELLDRLARLLGPGVLRQLGVYKLPTTFKLSVVIPVYNERGTVAELVRRVQAVPIDKEILLVDDGSTDGTPTVLAKLAEQPGVRLIRHERNQGKGAALRTGFAAATGDVVIVQDADLEYDPAEYPRLLQPIIDGRADVVYGSRFSGNVARIHLFWHRVANGVLTFASNVFTNLNLSDIESCYKVFRREVVQGMKLRENRFGIEPELTAKIARGRWRVYEMPISYSGRDYSEGKKIGWRDAVRALYCIVRYSIAD